MSELPLLQFLPPILFYKNLNIMFDVRPAYPKACKYWNHSFPQPFLKEYDSNEYKKSGHSVAKEPFRDLANCPFAFRPEIFFFFALFLRHNLLGFISCKNCIRISPQVY